MTSEAIRLIEVLISSLLGGGVGALIVKAYMANKQNEADADKAGVQVLVNRIDKLNAEIERLNKNQHELEDMHLSTVKKLSDTLVAVAERDARIKTLEAEKDILSKEIESLQRQATRKDTRIAEQDKRIRELETQVAEMLMRLSAIEHPKGAQ